MSRKLLLLNLGLLILIGGLGYVLRKQWLEAEAHTRTVVNQKVQTPAVMPPAPATPVLPVAPADYLEVATKTLYSSDRNPNVIVDAPKPPPPPPPMPALPVYYGQMAFGGDPVVVLTAATAPAQKSYSVGEKIGEFKLVAFNRDTITFEWNGKEIEKKLDEVSPKANAPASPQNAQQAPTGGLPAAALFPAGSPNAGMNNPAPNQNSVQTIGGNSANGGVKDPLSGPDMGGGLKGCVMGDTTPAGTVQNGWKKVMGGGLLGMGQSCHWEQQK